MNVNQPAFRPDVAATVKLAVTQATASKQVQSANTQRHWRIYNAGANPAYIDFGGSAITASVPGAGAGSMPIAAGTVQIISSAQPYLAAIADTGLTTTLYITPGEGM